MSSSRAVLSTMICTISIDRSSPRMLARPFWKYTDSAMASDAAMRPLCTRAFSSSAPLLGWASTRPDMRDSGFRIFTEKMISMGLEMAIMLPALARIQLLIKKRGDYLNRLEVRALFRGCAF